MASRPAQPLDEAIAQYLRQVAASQNLTMNQVAIRMGVHHNTFRHYYRGIRPMSTSDFVAFCDALGLPPGQVIDGARKLAAVPSTAPTIFWH